MGGSADGALKTAATKLGVTVEVYEDMRAKGLKHCFACRRWKAAGDFAADRSRGDGLKAICRECDKLQRDVFSHIKVKRARPKGRRFVAARDGDKTQARRRIDHLIQSGCIKSPNELACTDCGHFGNSKRHEYDHHEGYAAEHHESVEAVCATCHHDREISRGTHGGLRRKS